MVDNDDSIFSNQHKFCSNKLFGNKMWQMLNEMRAQPNPGLHLFRISSKRKISVFDFGKFRICWVLNLFHFCTACTDTYTCTQTRTHTDWISESESERQRAKHVLRKNRKGKESNQLIFRFFFFAFASCLKPNNALILAIFCSPMHCSFLVLCAFQLFRFGFKKKTHTLFFSKFF